MLLNVDALNITKLKLSKYRPPKYALPICYAENCPNCNGKRGNNDCDICLGTGFESAMCPNCGVDLPGDMTESGKNYACSNCKAEWTLK